MNFFYHLLSRLMSFFEEWNYTMSCYEVMCNITKCPTSYSFPLKTELLPVSCQFLSITAALWSCWSVNLILPTDQCSSAMGNKLWSSGSPPLGWASLPTAQGRQEQALKCLQPPERTFHFVTLVENVQLGALPSPTPPLAQPSRTVMFSSLIPAFSL